jgi:hypothetical protein
MNRSPSTPKVRTADACFPPEARKAPSCSLDYPLSSANPPSDNLADDKILGHPLG